MADIGTLFKIKTEPNETSIIINETKQKLIDICKSIMTDSSAYSPQKTVDSIDAYVKETSKIDRILYSEINSFIIGLDEKARGTFSTNIEKLLMHVLDDTNKVQKDSRRICVKIYDHFQLNLIQIENARIIAQTQIAETISKEKADLHREIKNVEREYVTILSIFAAIVLAFVGGITFSTSVLQNISKANIFRLLLTVDFLAFVLINTIYILVKFAFILNEKDTKILNMKNLNIVCFILAILIILAWVFNLNQLPMFISKFLPWG